MLHRVFVGMTALGASGFIGFGAGAFQGAQSDAGARGLLVAALVSVALFMVGGIGFLLTRESHAEASSPTRIAIAGKSGLAGNATSVQQSGGQTAGVIINHPLPPAYNPPTVSILVTGRCCRLHVTNNDVAEPFLIEVSQFMQNSESKLRPQWDGGDESKTLKRGETVSATIMCLEPDRPQLRGLYMNIVDRIPYNAWMKRVENKVRLVRFYGAQPQDIVVHENSGGSFLARVLSDHHEPISNPCTYAVTEGCRLLMPFDQAEIDRVNAQEKADRDRLLDELQERLDQSPSSDQSEKINS